SAQCGWRSVSSLSSSVDSSLHLPRSVSHKLRQIHKTTHALSLLNELYEASVLMLMSLTGDSLIQ
ncbi:hypothetical protein JOQ06_015853, partial [Pogonophryne albipinna]